MMINSYYALLMSNQRARDKEDKKVTKKQTQNLSCTRNERTINNSRHAEQKLQKNMKPISLYPYSYPNIKEPPPTFTSLIICCNNTMIMISLTQTRKMDVKMTGIMIFSRAFDSASPVSCKTPATSIECICTFTAN